MKNLIQRIKDIVFGHTKLEGTPANLALLLLRIYVGFTMMGAGLDKVPLPDWMIEHVADIGFPFPTFFAWLACFSEFAFGILLCFGLMTRLAAVFMAITIGVAAFGHHGSIPLIEMHITQAYFWAYVLFAVIGGGKFALDNWVRSSAATNKYAYGIATLPLIILFSYSMYQESLPPAPKKEFVIYSINIAGTFNNWDAAVDEMKAIGNDDYELKKSFEKEGLIEFKFTLNKTWDANLGDFDQATTGFPVTGIADFDKGNDTQNIRVYIPAAGEYTFRINSKTKAFEVK